MTESWVAIIDHSIDIGIKKALVVLRVPVRALSEKGKALQLTDCECIGLCVSEATDHKTIATQLAEIFKVAGNPTVIIKDQASNLSKGVKLWKIWAKVKKLIIVDDIGHFCANVLKAEFAKNTKFQEFLAITRKGAARLRQTQLAFLVPPKIRTKGRFQSISKLAAWAESILALTQKRGRAEINSPLDKLRKAFPEFGKYRSFLERLAINTVIINKICGILKRKGLNQITYQECMQLLMTLPAHSKVRKKLSKWLNSHLAQQAQLGMKQISLLVSSDIIECLFGKYKHILERSPVSDINRLALAIPALCGPPVNEQSINDAFSQTMHADIAKWEQENISHTLTQKRREVFKTMGLNTGTKNRE